MAIVTPGIRTASELAALAPHPWAGRFAAALAGAHHFPEPVLRRARLVLLDTIGAIAAGAAEPEIAALAARMPAGPAPVIGTPHRLAEGEAALVHGTAGTMLELDEGNQYCRGHPAIHVVPALLAAAPRLGVDGAALLRALILGYEAGARIGIASRLRVEMHPHGTWGAAGAAVGVAALHGAGADLLQQVLGIASTLGLATSRRTMLEGGTVRNAYAGIANRMGLLAWDLVQAGFEPERDGIATVFGGIAGTAFDPDAMTDALGARWEIARNYFKRHAACRYTHGALDALDRLLAAHPVAPDQVAAIEVRTYVWAAQLDDARPRNMLAAKFSLPYALAARLLRGAADVAAFRTPAREDPAILDLAARIRVEEDPALTGLLPGLRPARLALTLRDGRVLEAEAMTNRGDTEDPYTEAEIVEKFHELASPVLGAARAAAIVRLVMDAPGGPEPRALEKLLGA